MSYTYNAVSDTEYSALFVPFSIWINLNSLNIEPPKDIVPMSTRIMSEAANASLPTSAACEASTVLDHQRLSIMLDLCYRDWAKM